MNSSPTPPTEPAPRADRLGLALFFAYLVFYAGFVALCALAPELMRRRLVFGLNLAVAYGLALILAAVLLAFAYARLRRQGGGPR